MGRAYRSTVTVGPVDGAVAASINKYRAVAASSSAIVAPPSVPAAAATPIEVQSTSVEVQPNFKCRQQIHPSTTDKTSGRDLKIVAIDKQLEIKVVCSAQPGRMFLVAGPPDVASLPNGTWYEQEVPFDPSTCQPTVNGFMVSICANSIPIDSRSSIKKARDKARGMGVGANQLMFARLRIDFGSKLMGEWVPTAPGVYTPPLYICTARHLRDKVAAPPAAAVAAPAAAAAAVVAAPPATAAVIAAPGAALSVAADDAILELD